MPHFKGWDICNEASGDADEDGKCKTVALKDGTRIYFETRDGVLIIGEHNMSDKVTYNDLFIFFEGKLKLNWHECI